MHWQADSHPFCHQGRPLRVLNAKKKKKKKSLKCQAEAPGFRPPGDEELLKIF